MVEQGGEYEERFGFSMRTVALILISVIFVVFSVAGPMPVAARLLVGGFFGVGALVVVLNGASRKVALRIDASGVTLGGRPLRYAATTEHVPWSDVDAIVLWHQQVSTRRLPYFGIQRRPGAAAPRGSRLGERITGSLVPHVPVDLARSSRPITGWRLSRQELANAVDRFSPGTPIRNL